MILDLAAYLYAGLLFAEIARFGYQASNINTGVIRLHYPLILFGWPIAIGYVVFKHWRK